MAIPVAVPHRPLPAEHAPFAGAIGGVKDAQPHDLIALSQAILAIETAIEHRAAIDELRTCGQYRTSDRGRVVHASLELELVPDNGHANSASRTARVSLRVSKTCVASAARKAAVSKNPVATATVRAPIGRAQATSSGVSPTMTRSAPVNRRPVRSAARLAATAGKSARACESDRKSTRLNSSHSSISYAVFCLKK